MSTFDDPSWKTHSIDLPGGSKLSIQMTPTFIVGVRKHFKLSDDTPVTDAMLKEFFINTVRGAVEKAELEAFRDSTDQQSVIE